MQRRSVNPKLYEIVRARGRLRGSNGSSMLPMREKTRIGIRHIADNGEPYQQRGPNQDFGRCAGVGRLDVDSLPVSYVGTSERTHPTKADSVSHPSKRFDLS